MDFRTIILADRSGAELSRLNRATCPALLEVGDRAVIEYTLEDLARAGVRDALVISADVASLRESLGEGGRWGVNLTYLLSRPEQSPHECIRRAAADGPVLLVRGDIVRGRCISEFMEVAAEKPWRTAAAVSNRVDAGICLVKGEWTHGCTWPSFELGINVVELGDVGLFRLQSPEEFHGAAMAAVRGDIPGVELRGRESGNGLVIGRLARAAEPVVEDGRLWLGASARLEPGVTTSGTVAIGSGALVDEGARLENTVVMPGSYVGRHVELRNAIISGRRLIRVDIGATTEVADPFLLSDLRHRKETSGRGSWLDRAAGVVLMMLSAPLWPFALISSLLANFRSPMTRRRLISNHSEDGKLVFFSAWEWNTPIPLLRYLPWLLPVMSGHLRLVGVRPAPASGVGNTDLDATGAPAGLIGPALLDVSAEATEEEIMLGETLFRERDSITRRLRYLVRSLAAVFNRRAWSSAR
jgi:NDP-sugar pyrophosphorylase family protein